METSGRSKIDAARTKAVQEAIARIRGIKHQAGVTRAALAEMITVLEGLASRAELFSREAFPPPTNRGESALYKLAQEDDQSFALYLNSISPGKVVGPHNHMTWAIVVSVDGAETNRLYKRTDDGSVLGKAQVVFEREHIVEPGNGIAFMPEDIHSIAVEGENPTLHLHMYGRALETLSNRVAFNIEDGTCEILRPPTNILN